MLDLAIGMQAFAPPVNQLTLIVRDGGVVTQVERRALGIDVAPRVRTAPRLRLGVTHRSCPSINNLAVRLLARLDIR